MILDRLDIPQGLVEGIDSDFVRKIKDQHIIMALHIRLLSRFVPLWNGDCPRAIEKWRIIPNCIL